MRKGTKAQLEAPYSRILIPEKSGGYAAELLEFPGCVAQGATADEALRNLELAAEDWIEEMKAQARSIPEPLTGHGFSGAVSLRLPRSLHRRSMQLAERESTSLNQFLVSTVAEKVGIEALYERLCEQIAQKVNEAIHASMASVISQAQATVNLHLYVQGASSTEGPTVTVPQLAGGRLALNVAPGGTGNLLVAPRVPTEVR